MDLLTLALATSGPIASVALVHGDAVLCMRAFPHEMRLLERLMPTVDSVLRGSGVSLSDIGLIASDVGPGSFTGMRIGVMTAKAMAWATGARLVGVSSLEAIAHASGVAPVVAVVRARPGTVYWQGFDEGVTAMTDPGFVASADLVEHIARWTPRNEIVLAHTLDTDIEAVLAPWSGAADMQVRPMPHAVSPDARTVAAVAAIKLGRGQTVAPLELAPLYITEPIIGPPRSRD